MTPLRKTLVYFGHVPSEGAGSVIIILRHLQRFAAEGWDIFLVADWGQNHSLCLAQGWSVTQLSHRRPWWPPFKPDNPFFRAIRGWLWGGEVRAWLGDRKVDGVLTYLSAFSDTLSIAAVGFARRYDLPLVTLVHDDTRDFSSNQDEATRAHLRRQWTLQHSTTGWFASPELASCYQLSPEQVGVLPPIPEGAPPASSDFLTSRHSTTANAPLLVYAGNYWPPQLPTLALIGKACRTVGGTLLVVTKEHPEHVVFLREQGVSWRAPWPRNTEALDYYRDHASAMVVSYAPTSEEMPWTRTSYPSKLIEYCHLGLPIVIIAAGDTAVVHWARARNFPDVFSPDDTAGIASYVARLRDPAFWRERAALSLSFARAEFDPVAIHRRLTDSLLRK